jgi:hypothetical protein
LKLKLMKKILLSLAVAGLFTACKNKTEETNRNMVPLTESYKNNMLSDTAKNTQALNHPKDSIVTTTTVTVTKTPVNEATAVKNKKTAAPVASKSSNATLPSTASVPASTVSKKKGWSKAAKGTAIGAGAGAVTGAIIGKNVKGAVIGGAVGAAGGYIIGRAQDKKDGRVKN